jgi:hypothetical protein
MKRDVRDKHATPAISVKIKEFAGDCVAASTPLYGIIQQNKNDEHCRVMGFETKGGKINQSPPPFRFRKGVQKKKRKQHR